MEFRDTYKYELRIGNKVVYVGITNDPGRRQIEHTVDKIFTKMVIVGNRTTVIAARKWEQERLFTYRRNHRGEGPKYNRK